MQSKNQAPITLEEAQAVMDIPVEPNTFCEDLQAAIDLYGINDHVRGKE